MKAFSKIVLVLYIQKLHYAAIRAIFTPLQDPAQEHMLFIWTSHCVRACVRLRPDDVEFVT